MPVPALTDAGSTSSLLSLLSLSTTTLVRKPRLTWLHLFSKVAELVKSLRYIHTNQKRSTFTSVWSLDHHFFTVSFFPVKIGSILILVAAIYFFLRSYSERNMRMIQIQDNISEQKNLKDKLESEQEKLHVEYSKVKSCL